MHGHDRLRARRDRSLDAGRVDAVVVDVDVREDGRSARVDDDVDRGGECRRRRDHFVLRTDAGGDERQMQARGRRVERDRMLRAAVLCEVGLEALDARPRREPAGAQRVDYGIDLGV